jgi:hypothetical protein
MGLKDEIRKLKKAAGPGPSDGRADEETMPHYGEFWEMQMEWTALHLVRGLEPDFTMDETGTFVTLDGRFAVSPKRMDLRGLMGPRTVEIQEEIVNTPERWERFLEADEEAAELLRRLLELGEGTTVPEDYEAPLRKAWPQEEVDNFRGTLKPTAIFEDAAEREATRRLTWSLTHLPEAQAMFSELTRRRDAFVAKAG